MVICREKIYRIPKPEPLKLRDPLGIQGHCGPESEVAFPGTSSPDSRSSPLFPNSGASLAPATVKVKVNRLICSPPAVRILLSEGVLKYGS